ncbi:GrpB family protein [Microbacterium sp. ARD32]|uniref:GrpB family protein n=1 Tax=Microbacterium sp. ARD32 TaxID=2962577 RepID=UPI0028814303|nr:GrpB family protein [Microbacterium sp. ARD32]MDT0157354.1 GrpB family protein [Microbacterium sp. ARD32]
MPFRELSRDVKAPGLVGARSSLRDAFRDSGLGLRRGVVELSPASDAWARTFSVVQEALAATAPASVVAIEHIGSTSVPGLDAKPILDVGIAVRSGTELASLDDWLIGLGMLLRGDATDVRPDRMYGYELEPMIRLANVHVVEAGSEAFRRYLRFRDHLRANPSDRDAYAALKRALAAQHPDDRLAYIDGKADFITARRDDAS